MAVYATQVTMKEEDFEKNRGKWAAHVFGIPPPPEAMLHVHTKARIDRTPKVGFSS